HGGLAREFVSAMEHVVGAQQNVTAICIGPDDDMERRRVDILEAVKAVDTGEGVV
ncbi:MAG TPA: PTS fructose transporter subunit IIA, partial [Rhodospirillaceae bacterium]|nr:PTS fructose transporter subunit IIA [Rhodospirillaceae bacterium]